MISSKVCGSFTFTYYEPENATPGVFDGIAGPPVSGTNDCWYFSNNTMPTGSESSLYGRNDDCAEVSVEGFYYDDCASVNFPVAGTNPYCNGVQNAWFNAVSGDLYLTPADIWVQEYSGLVFTGWHKQSYTGINSSGITNSKVAFELDVIEQTPVIPGFAYSRLSPGSYELDCDTSDTHISGTAVPGNPCTCWSNFDGGGCNPFIRTPNAEPISSLIWSPSPSLTYTQNGPSYWEHPDSIAVPTSDGTSNATISIIPKDDFDGAGMEINVVFGLSPTEVELDACEGNVTALGVIDRSEVVLDIDIVYPNWQ